MRCRISAYEPLTGVLSFAVGKLSPNELERLTGLYNADIELSYGKWYQPRGNQANAYFWVLVRELAEFMGISDSEVHDKYLADNISYVIVDGARDWQVADWPTSAYNLAKVGDEYYLDSLDRVALHKPDGTPYMKPDGTPKMSKLFWHVKGTHQMNSKEMSRIIDSLVFDCREHGLKTKSDLEFERIMKAWEKIEKNT